MSKVAGTKTNRGPSTNEAGRITGSPARKAGKESRSTVGAEMIAALQEVADALQASESLEKRFTVRRYHLKVAPRTYGPDDVRRVRESLRLSQPLFAQFLGASLAAVRSWEQGKRPPSLMARRFLEEIEAEPLYWRKRLITLADVEEQRPE
jgi:putative transcriptional regulator